MAFVQEPALEPGKSAQNPRVPTITFSFYLEGGQPGRYAVVVEATGRAAYRSDAPEREAAGDPATPSQKPIAADVYLVRFTLSRATRERLFQLAEQLNYFDGSFDYKKGRIANMGAKTLVYADPARHFETSYNWSQNPQIDEVTRLFQGISATLEFGRQLQDDFRYRKLGLDSDLKNMEDAAKMNGLLELQLIAPTLQKIAHDTSVMHIARVRAQRLLAKVPPQETGAAPGPASR